MPEVGGDGDGHLGVQALPVEPVQRDTPVERRCKQGISVIRPNTKAGYPANLISGSSIIVLPGISCTCFSSFVL